MRGEHLATVGFIATALTASAEQVSAAEHPPVRPPAKEAGRLAGGPSVDAAMPVTIEYSDNLEFSGDRLTDAEIERVYWAYSLATDYWKALGYEEPCAEDLSVVLTQEFDVPESAPTPSGGVDVSRCIEWVNSSPLYVDNAKNLAWSMTRVGGLARGVKYSSDKRSLMYSRSATGAGNAPEATLASFNKLLDERLPQLKASQRSRRGHPSAPGTRR